MNNKPNLLTQETKDLIKNFCPFQTDLYKKENVTVGTRLLGIPFSTDGKDLISKYFANRFPEQKPISCLHTTYSNSITIIALGSGVSSAVSAQTKPDMICQNF